MVHGDKVGGDKIGGNKYEIHLGSSSTNLRSVLQMAGFREEAPVLKQEQIRLDVAAPTRAQVDVFFLLAIAIKQLSSPPLSIADLPEVTSEMGEIFRSPDQPIVRYRVNIEVSGLRDPRVQLHVSVGSGARLEAPLLSAQGGARRTLADPGERVPVDGGRGTGRPNQAEHPGRAGGCRLTQPQPSPNELQRQLVALEQSLAALTTAGMGEAELGPLRARAEGIRQEILTGGGAVAGGNVDTRGGDFVGRDKIVEGDEVRGDKIGRQVNAGGGNVVITAQGSTVVVGEAPVAMTAVDRQSALGRYLQHVISRNRYLQLQGIRSGGRLVTSSWITSTSRCAPPASGWSRLKNGGWRQRQPWRPARCKGSDARAASGTPLTPPPKP